jgi:hypothetical protein
LLKANSVLAGSTCDGHELKTFNQETAMKVTSKIRGGLAIASLPRSGGCRGGSQVFVA